MEVTIENINLIEEAVEIEELQTRCTLFEAHFHLKFTFLESKLNQRWTIGSNLEQSPF